MGAILPRQLPITTDRDDEAVGPEHLDRLIGSLGQAFDLIENFERWRIIGGTGQPAFSNGWGNEGSAEDAAFRRNILGQVEIRGLLANAGGFPNGNGTIVFTLPKGYRPKKLDLRFPQVGVSAGGALIAAEAVITSAGNVTVSLSGIALFGVVDRVTFQMIFKP